MEPLLVLSLWTAQIVGGSVPRGAAAPARQIAPAHRSAPARRAALPRGGYGGWWPWNGGSNQVVHEVIEPLPADRNVSENQRIQGLVVTSAAYRPETAKPAMKEYTNLPAPVPFTATVQTPPAGSR